MACNPRFMHIFQGSVKTHLCERVAACPFFKVFKKALRSACCCYLTKEEDQCEISRNKVLQKSAKVPLSAAHSWSKILPIGSEYHCSFKRALHFLSCKAETLISDHNIKLGFTITLLTCWFPSNPGKASRQGCSNTAVHPCWTCLLQELTRVWAVDCSTARWRTPAGEVGACNTHAMYMQWNLPCFPPVQLGDCSHDDGSPSADLG